MKPRLFAGAACVLLLSASAASAGPTRTLDPLAMPPAEREMALTAALGRYGPFGEPADPGCYWSRFSTPTPQGVRWLLEEECSGYGTQAH
jgi:hypothetical protein